MEDNDALLWPVTTLQMNRCVRGSAAAPRPVLPVCLQVNLWSRFVAAVWAH
jgi:hypothetical protein